MDERDPDSMRVLTVDERCGIKVPDEPQTTRERLTAARKALVRAERSVATCTDLVEYLENQL